MIVTKNSFVCYSLLRGTIGLQLALLTISLYTIFAFPGIANSPNIRYVNSELFISYTHYYIPSANAIVLLVNIVADILRYERFKQWAMLLSMLVVLTLLSAVTICLCAFPEDIESLTATDTDAVAYRLWLMIELMVIIGLITSGSVFLSFRSCLRQKVSFDQTPENKQVPETDTVVAIADII